MPIHKIYGGDSSNYNRSRCYNPKVHVSGWHNIQHDEAYIQNYNRMRDFYMEAYPTESIHQKYQSARAGGARKNLSDKRVIFYEEGGEGHWVTESRRAFKEGERQSGDVCQAVTTG
ncbi:hypothetical protein PCYB_032440 [Plasmodium cynomolgi strain B]|uniref:Uncharacterized protein n=1 Tax=Plasmodium cynomolgi (strain B) TaxID=1120755 RepID=K6V6U1_PLACD|nr:hypothetical protein PCYB_032440 [Plasmodium cynomolgi strain B]GAB64832.1 hypothetical protein PCYB_032440 [Plasmodium cynomolgi strain B]